MSSKRRQRRVAERKAIHRCVGKQQHKTQEQAVAHATSLRFRNPSARIDAYRCEQCQMWHVGHRPKHVQQKIIEQRRKAP